MGITAYDSLPNKEPLKAKLGLDAAVALFENRVLERVVALACLIAPWEALDLNHVPQLRQAGFLEKLRDHPHGGHLLPSGHHSTA